MALSCGLSRFLVPHCSTGIFYRGLAVPTIKPFGRPSRRPNRHRDEKYRAARAAKFIKVELQDYEFERKRVRDEITPEEMKERMKKLGITPSTPWQEKPIYISSTGTVLESYVPPEGDGKASLVSTTGAKQVTDLVKGKGKTMSSVRKIRSYEDEFDPREWSEEAQEIYIAAHAALAAQDEDKLHSLVTEKCYPEMMYMANRKTIRWNFIKSLEPPRVVHARHAEILTKENIFGQLTVRFHTQQTLAVYDRFGRLIHGSEHVAKDVLEYCVFEKHLSNVYGNWRLHAKIIPDWMPKSENNGLLTYRVPPEAVGKKAGKDDRTGEKRKEKEEGDEEEAAAPSLLDRFGRIINRS